MTVEPSNNISVFRRDTEWSSHVRINRSKGEQRKTRVIWLLLTLCLPFPHCFVNQMRFIDGDNAWMSLNTCLLFKRKLIYRNVIYLKGERDIYMRELYLIFVILSIRIFFFFSCCIMNLSTIETNMENEYSQRGDYKNIRDNLDW